MYKESAIAAIGGGTGLSTLLRGLKNYTDKLAAIVNVTDNGGSSGMLRENLGMLPPGDIRNCLLALADTEPLMEKVFQYRFTAGEGLKGHTLGNLFIAALTETLGFEGALDAASKVLAVKGSVLPVTLEKLTLVAVFDDGCEVYGESQITAAKRKIKRLRLDPPCSRVYPAAERAILESDIVVVGPGSLYTSVLSNLLVPGVTEALRCSRARRIYICNVMTQPGETDGFSASDHVHAIFDHVGDSIFDTVIVNSNRYVPAALLDKYAAEERFPVNADVTKLKKLGLEVLAADLLAPQELVRHDSNRLARLVLSDLRMSHWRVC